MRVGIIGDPSGGDGGMGIPGCALIFNDILDVSNESPDTLVLPPFKFDNVQHFIQVPANGGPYQLALSFQFAGAEWPMDAEIEANFRWMA